MVVLNNMPFFSVLIPSYNRPEYLPKAVASVLQSTFIDFELIVSDDASPRQAEIRSALSPFLGDSRLKFVEQKVNLGEASSRDFLTNSASGKFLVILGDDDLLHEDALAVLKSEIDKDSNFSIYLFGYNVIDEHGKIYETRRALKSMNVELSEDSLTKDFFCFDFHPFWLYHPATFCFPSTLRDIVRPSSDVGIGDDLMILLDVVLSGGRLRVIPDVLFSYRKFSFGSYSQANQSRIPFSNPASRSKIMYKLLDRKDLKPWARSFLLSEEFRRRFLFNPILTDASFNEEALGSLGLSKEHYEEFVRYAEGKKGVFFRIFLVFQRIIKAIGYFGISGLADSAHIFYQRITYRLAAVNN